MTTFKELIDKYVDDSSEDEMRMLTCKMDKFVEEVRELHPEMVDKFLMKVDLVLNPSFTKDTAKWAVSKMKNKDGTENKAKKYFKAMYF